MDHSCRWYNAHVSAVVAMTGGGIAREVLEAASTDLRLLFQTAQGRSKISCLLGVVDLRGDVGVISPIWVRAADGTTSGHGSFDLNRRRMDVAIGSEAATTGALALDLPVRISGPFADPGVRPARWLAAGRAQLQAGDEVGRLLPGLQPFARRSACLSRPQPGR